MSGGSKSPSNPSNLRENTSESLTRNDFRLGPDEFPSLVPSNDAFEKGVAENPRTTKWRSVLMEDKGSSVDPSTGKLPYHKPQLIDGKKISIISSTDLVDELRVCNKFLVGYFVGRKLPFHKVKEALDKAWNLKGEFRMSIHEDSMFIFEFDLDEDRSSAMELGYVFVLSSLFLIRPWQLFIEQDIKEMKTIHVWLKLRNIPTHLWNAKGIGMITSVVGVPLFADKHTLARTRMSYARACVEMDANSEFPDCIPVSYDGKNFDVSVEYSWKPSRCLSCSTFGHTSAKCPKEISKKKMWIPKTKGAVETVAPQGKGSEGLNVEGSDASMEVVANSQGSKDVVSAGQEAILDVQELSASTVDNEISTHFNSCGTLQQPLVNEWKYARKRKSSSLKKDTHTNVQEQSINKNPFEALSLDSEIAISDEAFEEPQRIEEPDFNVQGSDYVQEEVAGKNDNGETEIMAIEKVIPLGNIPDSIADEREEMECAPKGTVEACDESSEEEIEEGKVKSVQEVSQYIPLTKDQHMDRLAKFTSSLGLGRGGKEGEVKKILSDIVGVSEPLKNLDSSNDDLRKNKEGKNYNELVVRSKTNPEKELGVLFWPGVSDNNKLGRGQRKSARKAKE